MYSVLLYIHILSSVLAIGPFVVMFPLVRKMRSDTEPMLEQSVQLFRFVVQLSKHTGHVLVISGIALVMLQGWSWKTPWILCTIILLISVLFFMARAFSPTLRRLLQPEFQDKRPMLLDKLNRSLWLYLLILLLLLWLMVAKPNLW
ncbi:DUF2269 family protein [Paenibacillus sp. y28]|uniref:DUF2269 family protein n=1 Tax=Paenibacillus sp. y28 TaxID=3129110 RepID=UPI00301627D5